jgi:hypothetical protein
MSPRRSRRVATSSTPVRSSTSPAAPVAPIFASPTLHGRTAPPTTARHVRTEGIRSRADTSGSVTPLHLGPLDSDAATGRVPARLRSSLVPSIFA